MADTINFRNEYGKFTLLEKDLPQEPVILFEQWLKDAFEEDLPEPSAMTLSTCNASGRISSRVILLKGFDSGGFQFYTNYKSRKSKDLADSKHAALNFFWPELERQVRIEGVVEKITAKDSDLYHSARPRNNQLGAWASQQSEAIADRETLEEQFRAVEEVYKNHKVIPRPPNWGGFRLKPDRIEFWQGRENRLHDRIEYNCGNNGKWCRQRLNP